MSNINWAKIRETEFPYLTGENAKDFLDWACVGLAPTRVVAAVKDYAEYASRNDEISSGFHHGGMHGKRHKAYEAVAKMLNADEDEIALVENTSHGLNIAATSIIMEEGDNIVTTDNEFIQVALPWCAMRQQRNIEIREAKREDNRFGVEDFIPLCDEKTKAIVISAVEWSTGWKIDLKPIGEFCKEKGIFLVVDMVQMSGTDTIDTKDVHVDFLCSGCHKWLNAPFGTGFCYINKETQKKINPAYWGYGSAAKPNDYPGSRWENPAAKAVASWEWVRTAALYETGGTGNYSGAVALAESIGLYNELGYDNIRAKCLENVKICHEVFKSLGGTILSDYPDDHLSAIVCARLYKDIDVERKVMNDLLEKGILISLRFTNWHGGLRISCHCFNNKGDFDRLKKGLEEIIADIGYAPDFGK